jgi:hypothetical protein
MTEENKRTLLNLKNFKNIKENIERIKREALEFILLHGEEAYYSYGRHGYDTRDTEDDISGMITYNRRDDMMLIREKKVLFSFNQKINNSNIIENFRSKYRRYIHHELDEILNYIKSNPQIFTKQELCITLLELVSDIYPDSDDFSSNYTLPLDYLQWSWEYKLCIYLLEILDIQDIICTVDSTGNNVIEYCLVNGYVKFLDILISRNLITPLAS